MQRPRPHFERTKDFGLTYPSDRDPGRCRWASARSRSIRSTCSAPTARSPTAACGCRARSITKVVDVERQAGLADRRRRSPRAREVISPQAAYIITDILAGNTDTQGQPVLGQVGDLRRAARAGRPPTRPARRATTATSPPTATSPRRRTRRRPALAVGVWMGNSDNAPNDGKLSLDTSAPLWSAILTEVSKGMPIAKFKAARAGSRRPPSTRSPASSPGRSRRKTVKELFLPGTVPDPGARRSGSRSRSTRRAACCGRTAAPGRRSRGASSTSPRSRRNFPAWQKAEPATGPPARPGAPASAAARRARGPSYFYNGAFAPFGVVGRAVRADATLCPLAPPPSAAADPFAVPTPIPPPPSRASRADGPADGDDAQADRSRRGRRQPRLTRAPLRARRSSRRRRPRRARRAGPTRTSGWPRPSAGRRRAGRRCPGRG